MGEIVGEGNKLKLPSKKKKERLIKKESGKEILVTITEKNKNKRLND